MLKGRRFIKQTEIQDILRSNCFYKAIGHSFCFFFLYNCQHLGPQATVVSNSLAVLSNLALMVMNHQTIFFKVTFSILFTFYHKQPLTKSINTAFGYIFNHKLVLSYIDNHSLYIGYV